MMAKRMAAKGAEAGASVWNVVTTAGAVVALLVGMKWLVAAPIEKRIDAVTERVDTLTERVDQVTDQVEGLLSGINDNTEAVKTLTASISFTPEGAPQGDEDAPVIVQDAITPAAKPAGEVIHR